MTNLKTMTPGLIILLTLTIFTWLVLMGILKSVIGVDGTGDRDIFLGLRWILACVLVGAVWIWISGSLLVASGQGAFPMWVSIAALILCPVSAAAAWAALYVVSETSLRWPLIIPNGIPPLMAVYVLALYKPSLRGAMESPVAHILVWGVVLGLSMPVWPIVSRRMEEKEQKRVQREKDFAAQTAGEKERKRQEYLEKVKTMPPDADLTRWYDLLAPENGVRPESLEALKKVERRQRDVEEGLSHGIPVMMQLVPELDLSPTPKLCNAAHAYLKITADGLKIKNREPYPYQALAYIDQSFPGVRWLMAHGCNCDEGITAIETEIKTYLDSPDRQKVLSALATLKQSH